MFPVLLVLGFSIEVEPADHPGRVSGSTDLTRDRLDPIARRATAPGETIHNEPFEVTPDMVADAILAADAIGGRGREQRGWMKSSRKRRAHGDSGDTAARQSMYQVEDIGGVP